MTHKIPMTKHQRAFGHWDLVICWSLGLGHCLAYFFSSIFLPSASTCGMNFFASMRRSIGRSTSTRTLCGEHVNPAADIFSP